MIRKRHVHADQVELGGYVGEREAATLSEVVSAFDISEATARRNLDGLVAQRLLAVRSGSPRIYYVPGPAGGAAAREIAGVGR